MDALPLSTALPDLSKLSTLPSMSSMSMLGVPGDEKYNLMTPNNNEVITKKIADQILTNIKNKYFDRNLNDTPEKVKARIKKDLLSIYYEPSNKKNVKANLKELICRSWYSALKRRNDPILEDLVTLMDRPDEPDPEKMDGGRKSDDDDSDDDNDDNKSSLTPQPMQLVESKESSEMNALPAPVDFQSDNKNTNKLQNAVPIANDISPFNVTGPSTPDTLSKEDETKKQKLQYYIENLVKYKTKLIEVEYLQEPNLTTSFSVSNVNSLHESLISKVACNYAAIDRNLLVAELKKIVLGENAANELTEYNKTKVWNTSTHSDNKMGEDENSIYQLFIAKLRKLSNKKYKHNSEPIVRSPPQSKIQVQKGGVGVVPEYMPPSYKWDNIKTQVEEGITKLIEEKIDTNFNIQNSIKEGFKEVFLQVNCDSLDLSSELNNTITTYLNIEYRNTLDYLCKRIPDKYAISILQSYILRNFAGFAAFIETTLKIDQNPVKSYLLSYQNVTSLIFDNQDVIPVHPKIIREVVPKDEENDKLDNCCNERKEDQKLDYEGVSDYLVTKSVDNEPSIFDKFTPAVITPVFNKFKQLFTECAKDEEFLKELFDMYNGRSIKFIKQIQMQFTKDDNGINDFIERSILTKHPYTKDNISECIKHVANIKFSLFKQTKNKINDKDVDVNKIFSQYALFLIYMSLTPQEFNDTYTTPYIDFVQTQWKSFESEVNKYNNEIELLEVNYIIENIPIQENTSYENSLKLIFDMRSATSKQTRSSDKSTKTSNPLSTSTNPQSNTNEVVAVAVAAHVINEPGTTNPTGK
jgi:hypothetical protein